MAVTDVSPFRQKVALLYNTSVADSLTVADYICAQYGIPAANKFGFAGGTSLRWAYSATRYADFWVPLAAHLDTIGAQAVLVCAGCPQTVQLADPGGSGSARNANLISLAGLAKRIATRGDVDSTGEPRVLNGSIQDGEWGWPEYEDGNWTYMIPGYLQQSKAGTGSASPWASQYTGKIEYMLDPILEAAWPATSLGTIQRSFTQFVPGWSRDFSALDSLPVGHIGWLTTPGTTHDADLFNKSKAIIDRGISAERTMADAKANTRIFFAIFWPSSWTDSYNAGKHAVLIKRLKDSGFANVTYYYNSDRDSDLAAMVLAPPSGGIQSYNGGMGDWNPTTLTAHTVADPASVTFDIGVGGGFNYYGTTDGDNWIQHMIGSKHTLFLGGDSNSGKWARDYQAASNSYAGAHTNSHAWITGNIHQSSVHAAGNLDVFRAMYEHKLSLLEASFLGYENVYFATGNPLMRPFV